jgi:signal-transduction protein with cAMP-binding, CBS, and nucleotidyltransferase domain
MHRHLEVVPQETTIVVTAERMREKRIGSLLLESTGAQSRLSSSSGIVTESDLIRKALAKEIDLSLTMVGQIMTSPLLTITPDRLMLDASHLMEMNQARYLCVSEKDEISGIISMRDLARYFVDSEGGPIRDLDGVYRPLGVLMRSLIENIETIASEGTVLEAAQKMAEKQIGSLLVIEAGEMIGIVTETDLVRKVIASHLPACSTSVRSVMNYPLIQIDINCTVREASRLMAKEGIRHLAVTEENKVVGLVSLRDLVKMVSVRDKPRFLRNT